jgi:hypothetical protein
VACRALDFSFRAYRRWTAAALSKHDQHGSDRIDGVTDVNRMTLS